MTMSEREGGTTREELVQRVALMEEMIAEGGNRPRATDGCLCCGG